MQKVAAVDTGDIEKDLKAYLDPTVWDPDRGVDTGVPCDCKIYGFVSKAEDTAPFTTTQSIFIEAWGKYVGLDEKRNR